MLKNLKQIKDLKIKKDTKILLRVDFNVPINKLGKITDTFRIDQSLETISSLQKKGAKIILIAHREEGSLRPVANYLKKSLTNFKCSDDCLGEKTLQIIENLKSGEVLLLENLRNYDGEKKNDKDFAKILSSYADCYINDAFSASHRNHASIVGIPKYLPSAIGPLFAKEISFLEKALIPKKPFLFILGGAKFDTKLGLLQKYITLADTVFVGGALAHNFYKAYDFEVGNSLIDLDVKLSKKVLDAHNIILPIDVLVKDSENKTKIILPENVSKNDKIVDFGKETLDLISQIAKDAKTIVWNGPLGLYEEGFDKGTKDLLKVLGSLKNKTIILGGGDTVSVASKIMKKNKELKFTHISTGGGAMIDFLSKGTFVGIEAIKKSK